MRNLRCKMSRVRPQKRSHFNFNNEEVMFRMAKGKVQTVNLKVERVSYRLPKWEFRRFKVVCTMEVTKTVNVLTGIKNLPLSPL